MDSAETNKLTIEAALSCASEYKDKGALLSISVCEIPETYICRNIPVSVHLVKEDSILLTWQQHTSEQSSRFMLLNGNFTVWVKDASVSIVYTPKKSIEILQGKYKCVLTEVSASAFDEV